MDAPERAAPHCAACGAQRHGDAAFCVACGEHAEPLPTESPGSVVVRPNRTSTAVMGVCQACDLELSEAGDWCPRCGTHEPTVKRKAQPTDSPRPSGWYPDPFGRARSRWWDGRTWSAYVADGAVHWDPLSFETHRQPGLRGIGIAIAGFVVGLAIGFPAALVMHETGEPGGRAALILVSALTLWVGIGGALCYVTFARGTGSLVQDYGLRFRLVDVPLGVAGWIAGRVLGAIMILPIVAVWPDLEPTRQGIFEGASPSTATWIVLAVVVCIGAPFIEELFFRGLVQTRLVDRVGAVAGITITAVLFGAAHLIGWVGPITFVYAVALTGAGLVLGLLRHLTGRLGASIVAHVCFNVQALIVFAILR